MSGNFKGLLRLKRVTWVVLSAIGDNENSYFQEIKKEEEEAAAEKLEQ